MVNNIKFGPAGLGSVKEAIKNLELYHELGLEACEIAFTYGAYIKNKEDAEKIGKKAKELNIRLSIHAPYWINLNSDDEKKVRQSKERILESLKVGSWLDAEIVVFHPGFYGKKSKEETYEKIKNEIIDLEKERRERKYTAKLAPETTGKVNVFGSIEEIANLVKETGCGFCIDFAHIKARYKEDRFSEVFEKFSGEKNWHVHFSGINYGEKGEKNHIPTPDNEIKNLLNNLINLSDKKIVIINEAPDPITDSKKMLDCYKKQK